MNIYCSRHYRLTKQGVLRLTDILEPSLRNESHRGNALTPLQKVCLALCYYGGGTFQHTSGSFVKQFIEIVLKTVFCINNV